MGERKRGSPLGALFVFLAVLLVVLYYSSSGFEYWDRQTVGNIIGIAASSSMLLASMILPILISAIIYHGDSEARAIAKDKGIRQRLHIEWIALVWLMWAIGMGLYINSGEWPTFD
jgi:hypothetical protein